MGQGGPQGGMPVPPQNTNMGMPQQPMPPVHMQQQNANIGMPPQPGPPVAPGGNQARVNLTPQQRYFAAAQKIIPSCTERNPYMKEQVGSAIFEFVTMIVP